MSARTTTRQLIKFSLYSTCLVLPKKMLDTLGWSQGSSVSIRLDQTHGRLIIEPTADTKRVVVSQQTSQTIEEESSPPIAGPVSSSNYQSSDDVLPIPELS